MQQILFRLLLLLFVSFFFSLTFLIYLEQNTVCGMGRPEHWYVDESVPDIFGTQNYIYDRFFPFHLLGITMMWVGVLLRQGCDVTRLLVSDFISSSSFKNK